MRAHPRRAPLPRGAGRHLIGALALILGSAAHATPPVTPAAPDSLGVRDEDIVAAQLADYALTTCPVSGEELGLRGEPVNIVHANRLIRLCCQGCRGAFDADPAKYVALLDQAVVARDLPGYPLDTCVISGAKLGSMGAPVDYVHAGQLVRFCCGGCVAGFLENPAAALEKIAAARAARGQPVAAPQ